MEKDREILRCAVYTRKSHEDGLEESDYNSLDAQREAAENYIASQKENGWVALPERYDDGGFSGGNMERPALKRLLTDVEAGKIDIICVYKLDRLSRSLLDFMKLAEMLEQRNVSFVSVTQDINTSTSAGRMMLNILMTFSEYERLVIAERIRTSVAGAKRRGKHCGGTPILGYDSDPDTKKLIVNEKEAKLVRYIFKRFSEVGSPREIVLELNKAGYRTKSWITRKGKFHEGSTWNTGHIYRMLRNRIYIGEILYKGEIYPAEHDAVISSEMWEKVSRILKENQKERDKSPRKKTTLPLSGIIRCGHCGGAMMPTYSRKGKRRYSYYLCRKYDKGQSECPLQRISANDIEKAVFKQLNAIFKVPSLISKVFLNVKLAEEKEREELLKKQSALKLGLDETRQQALDAVSKEQSPDLGEINKRVSEVNKNLKSIASRLTQIDKESFSEAHIREAFSTVDEFWDSLFPVERKNLVGRLVDKIEIRESGIGMFLKTDGIESLISEIVDSASEAEHTDNNSLAINNNSNPRVVPEILPDGRILIQIPMLIKRLRGRKKIIMPETLEGLNQNAVSPVQEALVQALSRSVAWMEKLENGEAASVNELSEKLGFDPSYVRRILKIGTLAPDIIESIMKGEEPEGLNFVKVLRAPVPFDWEEQRQIFGFTRK
jgi:site-specific DNA recombinase